MNMHDREVAFWHSRSQQFYFVWFSFLGGILVLGDAFSCGREFVNQGALQLGKFGSEALLLEASRIAITRSIPVNVGMILACLSPLLGAFAESMTGKSALPLPDQEKILVHTRLKTMLIMTPILILCGVMISLMVAYFHSSHGNLQDLIDFRDYLHSVLQAVIFTVVLTGVAYFEIKTFSRKLGMSQRIAVCIVAILVNSAAILVVDMVLMHLLARIGTI